MAITSQTLSQLQAAGSAVNAVGLALQQELAAHSQALMEQMASQPFGPEADSAYQQMRQVARLVHEMNSLEQQLKAIYLDAAQKVHAEVPVLPALPSATRGRRVTKGSFASSPALVEDAKVVNKVSGKHKERKQAVSTDAAAYVPKAPNAERLLQALKKNLGKHARTIGHAELAAISGLPRGSISAAVQKLTETKKLAIDSHGRYKLA